MADLLRVSSIIALCLAIIASPVIYLIEALWEEFHALGFFLAFILGFTQVVMLIVICSTRDIRTIKIFLIIVTGLFDNIQMIRLKIHLISF